MKLLGGGLFCQFRKDYKSVVGCFKPEHLLIVTGNFSTLIWKLLFLCTWIRERFFQHGQRASLHYCHMVPSVFLLCFFLMEQYSLLFSDIISEMRSIVCSACPSANSFHLVLISGQAPPFCFVLHFQITAKLLLTCTMIASPGSLYCTSFLFSFLKL